MEKLEREARANIPRGYGVITSGPLLPDDLVWNWPDKEWLRYDSTEWNQVSVIDAADCVCAIRTGRPDASRFGSARNYKIHRDEAPVATGPDEERPVNAVHMGALGDVPPAPGRLF